MDWKHEEKKSSREFQKEFQRHVFISHIDESMKEYDSDSRQNACKCNKSIFNGHPGIQGILRITILLEMPNLQETTNQ